METILLKILEVQNEILAEVRMLRQAVAHGAPLNAQAATPASQPQTAAAPPSAPETAPAYTPTFVPEPELLEEEDEGRDDDEGDAGDLGEAGADWLSEQGFETLDR